jgi:hypothetical protein
MMQNGLKMNGLAKDVMFQASQQFSTKNQKLVTKNALLHYLIISIFENHHPHRLDFIAREFVHRCSK